jgi:UDP-N-acetylglucosamine 1-carboxyvinyltransferase
MDQIKIQGSRDPLEGIIPISGSKNAVLPLMAASLLTQHTLQLVNVPALHDVETLTGLLSLLGVTVQRAGSSMTLSAKEICTTHAPYDHVRKMRASVLVLGPLLARQGHATVSLPGGCAIGARPVDLHIQGLEALGATIWLENGYIHATTPTGGLPGGSFTFPKISVTGSANLILASTLSSGISILSNVAQEPEIISLVECLQKMGAQIEGLGSSTLTIYGQSSLSGALHRVIADRIELGSYMIAALITRGKILFSGASLDLLPSFVDVLRKAGADIFEDHQGIHVSCSGPIQGVDCETNPFPGFPTDLQAQMMALLSVAQGASRVTESIFENRFMHVPEFNRMGASISVQGNTAFIKGVPEISGAPVMATDLRASMGLVLAALVAQGETTINRVYHLDRGYENPEEKLSKCGARIQRIHACPKHIQEETDKAVMTGM